jgi:hypothetical protein
VTTEEKYWVKRPSGPTLVTETRKVLLGTMVSRVPSPGFQMDRLADLPHAADGVLGNGADFFDHLDEGAGGTIADGRLVGVHFDDGVVHPHAGEGGNDVLDGVDLHRALGQGGGALDGLDLVHVRGDEGLVRQIDAAELETVAFRSGLDGEGDFFTRYGGRCR